MIRIFFFTIILLIHCPFYFSQNRISISPGYGCYLSNSENSTNIMGDENFRSYFILGFAYQRENLFGYNLKFEYNYHNITKENTLIFIFTDESGPEPAGYFGADVTLISHCFDLNIVGSIDNHFSYGIGPSIIFVNRIVEVDGFGLVNQNTSLYDKLASTGLGINSFLEVTIPFSENEDYFFFTSNIKLRYSHSVYFDKEGRNLDEYNQEFFTAQFSAGFGYAF